VDDGLLISLAVTCDQQRARSWTYDVGVFAIVGLSCLCRPIQYIRCNAVLPLFTV